MSEERLSKPVKFEVLKEDFQAEVEKFDEYTIFGRLKFQITSKEISDPISGFIVFFNDHNFKKDEYTYATPFSELSELDLGKQVDFLVFLKNVPNSLAKDITLEIQINGKKFTGVPYYPNRKNDDESQISYSSWEEETDSGVSPIDSIFIPNDEKHINSIELNIKIS